MEKIIIKGDLENIDRMVLKQAFSRVLDVRENTSIEGENYQLDIKIGYKNITGTLVKSPT